MNWGKNLIEEWRPIRRIKMEMENMTGFVLAGPKKGDQFSGTFFIRFSFGN